MIVRSKIQNELLFHSVKEESIKFTEQNCQLLKLRSGGKVFIEGDQASSIFLVVNGHVKLFKSLGNGRETSAKILTKHYMLGHIEVFSNIKNYTNTAEAITNSEILSLKKEIVGHLIETDQNFVSNLLKQISFQQYEEERHQMLLIEMNASQRLGYFLLSRFASNDNMHNRTFALPYKKSLIALYLDIQPETFSRAVRKLRDLHVHLDGKIVTIENIKLLKKFCCESIDTANDNYLKN